LFLTVEINIISSLTGSVNESTNILAAIQVYSVRVVTFPQIASLFVWWLFW